MCCQIAVCVLLLSWLDTGSPASCSCDMVPYSWTDSCSVATSMFDLVHLSVCLARVASSFTHFQLHHGTFRRRGQMYGYVMMGRLRIHSGLPALVAHASLCAPLRLGHEMISVMISLAQGGTSRHASLMLRHSIVTSQPHVLPASLGWMFSSWAQKHSSQRLRFNEFHPGHTA